MTILAMQTRMVVCIWWSFGTYTINMLTMEFTHHCRHLLGWLKIEYFDRADLDLVINAIMFP